MWLLRLLAVVLVIAVGLCLLAYAVTANRFYLLLARRLFAYSIVFALLVFALMFLERLMIIPW